MIRAARDAFGMYLKDGVRTPRANRTIAPVKIPKMKIIQNNTDEHHCEYSRMSHLLTAVPSGDEQEEKVACIK